MDANLRTAIFVALDEVNEQLPKGAKLEKSPDTRLFGADAPLDSLGLINLLSALEQAIEDKTGASISLTDALSMSPEESPFRTVATLETYLEGLL